MIIKYNQIAVLLEVSLGNQQGALYNRKKRTVVRFFKIYNIDVYVNVNCSSSETIHNRSKA